MTALVISVFVIGLICSAALTAVMKRVAPRMGLVDHPNERKLHTRPKPKGGGLAIFVATVTTILVTYIAVAAGWGFACPQGVRDALLDSIRLVVLILLAGAIFVLIGLVDDLRSLSVIGRLAPEFCLATLLYAFTQEVRITFFAPYPWVWFLMTVVWIVGITNSFNLLDNMDGLSAGVALIVGAIILGLAIPTGQHVVVVTLLAFLGALAGFLLFNFPPASIFMGDAGSLFVGYFMAVITTVCTFAEFQKGNILAASMPLLFLAVPLYDTATVVWIRYRSGRSIFDADKNHLSHRLVALGFSQRDAVLAIYLLTFCCAAGATLISMLRGIGTALVLAQVLGFLVLVALLERAGRRAVNSAAQDSRALDVEGAAGPNGAANKDGET